MNWKEKALSEVGELSAKDIKWVHFPKWLKFRIRFMNFLWDWMSIEAVKTGWYMPRTQFKIWRFNKRFKLK